MQEGEGGRMMDWVCESGNQRLVRSPLQLYVLGIDADERQDEMKKKFKLKDVCIWQVRVRLGWE